MIARDREHDPPSLFGGFANAVAAESGEMARLDEECFRIQEIIELGLLSDDQLQELSDQADLLEDRIMVLPIRTMSDALIKLRVARYYAAHGERAAAAKSVAQLLDEVSTWLSTRFGDWQAAGT